jgi:hypothetical protein
VKGGELVNQLNSSRLKLRMIAMIDRAVIMAGVVLN